MPRHASRESAPFDQASPDKPPLPFLLSSSLLVSHSCSLFCSLSLFLSYCSLYSYLLCVLSQWPHAEMQLRVLLFHLLDAGFRPGGPVGHAVQLRGGDGGGLLGLLAGALALVQCGA